MCGIAGILGGSWVARSASRVDAVSRAIAHRGPDDDGVLWLGPGPADAGGAWGVLVHRRLSVLDLSTAGRQPMSTPDGRHHLVYNGEIYNYLELRAELEREGVSFRSHGDTEVLLHAWARWGEACLSRLVGMFAFAVHDARTGETTLVRDLFGIKPIFYAACAHGLAFASEIKGLLELPEVDREADGQAVYDYLAWNLVDHTERSFFAKIRRVMPGHLVRVDRDGRILGGPRAWGSVSLGAVSGMGFDEAARRVREGFLENLGLHLRSDVRVGCGLSGGVDSSAIVAGLRRVGGEGLEIHCVSHIAEEDEAINEERWVDLAAAAAGAVVSKVRPRAADLAGDIDAMIAAQDEPFGGTSVYAQWRVYREARARGLKVMLGGQGADEMLAGYRPYTAARVASLLGRGDLVSAGRLLHASRRWPGGDAGHAFVRALWLLGKPVVLGTSLSRRRLRGRDWLRTGWFAERGVVGRLAGPPGGRDLLRADLHDSFVRLSLPALLRFEDRNSMASSIESRVPFLTRSFADLVFSLPEAFVLGPTGETKRVFKAAMRGIVPDAILDRRDKVGFATPERIWLRGMRAWCLGVLGEGESEAIGAVDAAAARALCGRVLSGEAPWDGRVWRWMNLVRWSGMYGVRWDGGSRVSGGSAAAGSGRVPSAVL
jgi:asparagine synthase (glutamine-hydrolysing)